MKVQDLERVVLTREPVTVKGHIFRMEQCTIKLNQYRKVTYECIVRDMDDKRYKVELDDLCYIDGTESL